MVKHKISWRNASEIPPGFLQEILQLIMEKNKVCFILISTVHVLHRNFPPKKCLTTHISITSLTLNHTTNGPVNAHLINIAHKKQILQQPL